MKNRPVMILKRIHSQEKGWHNADDAAGTLHGFGSDYEDMGEFAPGNFSTAIVEMPDGTIRMPRADMVRFLDV